MSHAIWRLGLRAVIPLDRPRIIGVLNVTPDSFFDGGARRDVHAHAAAAWRMVDEGADAIDVGGESTRPGAPPVAVEEQLGRVLPVIRAIRSLPGRAGAIPITIDTTRAGVAREALRAGADAINDVSAGLDDPGMLHEAASAGCGIVLMHRLVAARADSYSDQYERAPVYADVAGIVGDFLASRVTAALHAGIRKEGIVVDPGLGFGKSVEQNLLLLRASSALSRGVPLVSALSRKSFVGRVGLGRDSSPAERLPATLALSVEHLRAGAALFRVHDVAEHASALRAAWALVRGWPENENCPHRPPGVSGA